MMSISFDEPDSCFYVLNLCREYGIPAVVGTGNITQRVKNGQNITVDGDAGTVALIQDETDE